MSYTLGQLLFDTYEALGQVTTYVASGGSTTTAIKTGTGYTQSNLTGTLIVRETTDNAAPEGQYSEVTSFSQSTGTFTVGTAFTATIGAGDVFGYCSPLYPTQQMIEAINSGLRSLGDLVFVDTTTLDTASNQTEYAAAIAWKRKTPHRIDIQTNTTDSDDNRWVELRNWEYIPAAAGSTGLIVFAQQLPMSRDLRIWYLDKHPRVSDYDDVIDETIHPELAVCVSAYKATLWQRNRTQGAEKGIVQANELAKERLDDAVRKYKIWRPTRKGKILIVDRLYVPPPDDPSVVRL